MLLVACKFAQTTRKAGSVRKEPIAALWLETQSMFLANGSRNSDRDTRQCTWSCECRDVASEEGLAGHYDRQDLA